MDAVFVGREKELGRAEALIRVVRSGAEAVYCLEGGPGMGKTALTQRVLEMGRQAQLFTLRSTFVDGQDLPPLWPWKRMLSKSSRLLASQPFERERAKLLERHDLLLSHAEASWDSVPGLAGLADSQRKYRFFEWIERFLADLALTTPVLVSLEDLHNGDDGSLHLLEYLIDSLEYEPVLFLLSWRAEKGRGGERIRRLKEQIRFRANSAIEVLGPLGRAHIEELLSSCAHRTNHDNLEQVVAWTDGVPLRIWLYVEHLNARDPGTLSPGISASELFLSTIRDRLRPETWTTMNRLALLGNAFIREEIDALAPQGADTTSIVGELTAAGLLRSYPESPAYRFFHDEFRIAVVASLAPELRVRIAEECAAAIEGIGAGTNERRTRLLKELYLSANDRCFTDQTVRYTLESVALSRSQNAWLEVISDLHRLITQLGEQLEREVLLDLQLELCIAHHRSSKDPYSMPLAVELLLHFHETNDLERLTELLANFHFFTSGDEVPGFVEIVDGLLARLSPEEPRRPSILRNYGLFFIFAGDNIERASALFDESLALALKHGNIGDEIGARGVLALIAVGTRRFEEALSLVDQVLREHPSAVSLPESVMLMIAKLRALLGLGRNGELRSLLPRVSSMSRLFDHPFSIGDVRTYADRLNLRDGNWALLPIREPEQSLVEFYHQLPAVTAAYLTGRIDEADAYLASFMNLTSTWGLARRSLYWIHLTWFVAIRAYVLRDPRWMEEAVAKVTELSARGRPPVSGLAVYSVCAARFSRMSPCAAEAARSFYELLLENDAYYFEEEEYTTAAAKALLCLVLGDRRLAARHFAEAVAFCDKYEEKPWRAFYLFELALLLRESDPERSRRAAAESIREAERLGLTPLLERIKEEWQQNQGEAPRARARPGVAAGETLRSSGITRREQEVLACVVEGLTDKEIARVLNISPHTVGNHLRSIFEKTGSSNRGEAAYWAVASRTVRIDGQAN